MKPLAGAGGVPFRSSGLLPYGCCSPEVITAAQQLGVDGRGPVSESPFVPAVSDGQRCFPQFLVAVFSHLRPHFGSS